MLWRKGRAMSDHESGDEQLQGPSRGCYFLYFIINDEGAMCVHISDTPNALNIKHIYVYLPQFVGRTFRHATAIGGH